MNTAKKIEFQVTETIVRSGKIKRKEWSICERRIGQTFGIRSSLGVLILLFILSHAWCLCLKLFKFLSLS